MHHELDTLRKTLTEKIASRDLITSTGQVKSFEEYRSIVGQRTGLALALQEINGLLNKIETSED